MAPPILARRSAFTVVELLVASAVIAILIGLLLSSVQKMREAGNITRCSNNEKQLVLAIHNYHQVHSRLPLANPYQMANPKSNNAADGSAFNALLPFYDQDNHFKQYAREVGNPGYLAVTHLLPRIHVCPSEPTATDNFGVGWPNYGIGNYALNLAVFSADGMFKERAAPPYEIDNIYDGSAQTIAVVEMSAFFLRYLLVEPENADASGWARYWPNPDEVWGQEYFHVEFPLPQVHASPNLADSNLSQCCHGAMVVALLDGSVRRISPDVSQPTWTEALRPDDSIYHAISPAW